MKNTNLFLPSLPDDTPCLYDGENFYNPDDYRKIVSVLYIKPNRNILKSKILAKEKKKLLSQIIENRNLKDDLIDKDFINKLKQILPDGLCYENICTDAEYELLKKEFNIE